MIIAFKLFYCKQGVFGGVESHQEKKRTSLSFELGVVCDSQTIHLISWGIMVVNELVRLYLT